MTDKQIIIDVSDCSELCGTKCHILMSCTNTSKSDSCSEMPNCYYKQLKAKEQECEELKEQLTILDNEDVVVEITVKQFEEYKKLKAENKHLNDLLNQALKELEKTRETLTEIKEIINESFGSCYTCNSEIACKKCIRGNILNKISECEGNNGN